jgi:hypothetical protein
MQEIKSTKSELSEQLRGVVVEEIDNGDVYKIRGNKYKLAEIGAKVISKLDNSQDEHKNKECLMETSKEIRPGGCFAVSLTADSHGVVLEIDNRNARGVKDMTKLLTNAVDEVLRDEMNIKFVKN